jgi:hypothetical protein
MTRREESAFLQRRNVACIVRGESEHHGTAVAQHRDLPSILQTGIWMDQGKIKIAGPIDDVLDA